MLYHLRVLVWHVHEFRVHAVRNHVPDGEGVPVLRPVAPGHTDLHQAGLDAAELLLAETKEFLRWTVPVTFCGSGQRLFLVSYQSIWIERIERLPFIVASCELCTPYKKNFTHTERLPKIHAQLSLSLSLFGQHLVISTVA